LGVDLNGDGLSDDLVLMIQGSIGGVSLDTASFTFAAAGDLYVAPSYNNFTAYVFYSDILVTKMVSTLLHTKSLLAMYFRQRFHCSFSR